MKSHPFRALHPRLVFCSPPQRFAQDAAADRVAAAAVVVTRGQAIVTAQPDRAFVTIAAESRSKNSAEAQKQNAAAMTAVLQKIEQAGVPKDAIRTIGYELQPEFDYANGRQTFRNYVARNTVEVRLDDIDRVGAVIDAAGGRRRDDRSRASDSTCAIARRSSATRCGRRSPMRARAPKRPRPAPARPSIASCVSRKTASRFNRRVR